MAARKAKDGTAATPSAQARRAIASIGLPAMKTIIEKVWPEAGVKQLNSAKLAMACPMPWHVDHTPSFHWDFTDGHVHCYGCKYHTRDLFQILKDAKGMGTKEVVDLVHAYGSRLFSESTLKGLDARAVHAEATRVLMASFNRFMCRCLVPPPDDPDYGPAVQRAVAPALEWLFEARRHLRDQAPYMPFGLLPPLALLAKLNLEILDEDMEQRVANKQTYPDKEWREKVIDRIKVILAKADIGWAYCVTWHYGYGLTEPGSIKLRRPDDTKEIKILDRYEENAPLGFFGLYNPTHLTYNLKDADKLRLFVVEGENDCLTFVERYRESGMSGVMYVAGGGSAVVLDQLKDAGFDTAHVIADDPEIGKGTGYIYACLQTARRIKPYVFVGWKTLRATHPAVKDPDDAVLALGYRPFYDVAVDPAAFRKHYLSAMDWALDQVEERRLAAGDVSSLNELAASYGKYVLEPAAQAAFIETASTRFGLAAGPLRQAIVQTEQTAEAYRLRITQWLLQEFHPLFCVTTARTHMLHLWHRKDRREIVFPMHDGEAISKALCKIYGNFFTNVVLKYIGLPAFLSGGEVDGAGVGESNRGVEPEMFYLKRLYEYFKVAAEDLLQNLPEKSDCEWHGQGQHRLLDPAGTGAYAFYVNNGRTVYKGTFTHDGATALTWDALQGPADGKYLFRLEQKSWSAEITDANDLVQGNRVSHDDLRWAVGIVERALAKWVLRAQDTDSVFLARHLLAMAVPVAFDAKVIVSILGDMNSGKSTLMSIFSGGKSQDLRLLEHSRLSESYSAASIYQEWDGMSLGMCLDEFEDAGGNDTKSRAVEDIQANLRTIINETGAQIARGVANPEEGGVRKYRIGCFIMLASILKSRNAADDSRRIDIYTRARAGLAKPDIAVFEDIDRAEYQKVRRILSIGLYHYADAIRRNAVAIKRELNTSAFMRGRSYVVTSRFLDCLVPAAAIMELLGEDWRAFVYATCDQRSALGDFEAQSHGTAASGIADKLFYIPGIRLSANNRAEARLVDLLTAPDDDVSMLNASGCGIYYMREAKTVIINWMTVQVKNGVLDKVPETQRLSAKNYKHVFDQHPNTVRAEDVERLGIARFVQQHGDVWRKDLFSAYDARDLVTELERNKVATPQAQAASATTAEPTQHGSGNID